MAWRIVQQPNGKLARFSDVVDHFTDYDMSKDEAIELCREVMGRQDSIDKVQRGVEAGAKRFDEAISDIEIVHGKAEADKYRALLAADTP